jgi:DNA-binding MarR family transcriptional regulator
MNPIFSCETATLHAFTFGPASVRGIHERITALGQRRIAFSSSAVDTTMKGLAQKMLIEWHPDREHPRSAMMYRITDAGRAEAKRRADLALAFLSAKDVP